MKIFSKIYYLYKNYNIVKNLKWTKKGIFIYIMSFIGLIKMIISHPIYKIIKKLIKFLIIFEGILLIIYYTDLDDLTYLNITVTSIYIFIQEFYIKILKFIRDKLDYLLDNDPFEENNQSKDVNPNENNNSHSSNNSYYWWIGISIVIISSTVAIYYYYPNILDYFKDNDKGNGTNPSGNSGSPSNNSANSESNDYDHYFPPVTSNSIMDSSNTPINTTPIITITPDPDATPKPTSSDLPPVADEVDMSVFNRKPNIKFSATF